jgi:hypothetical protein
MRTSWLTLVLVAASIACSDDSNTSTLGASETGDGDGDPGDGDGDPGDGDGDPGDGDGDPGDGDGDPGGNPHPLYPALDLDTLPGDGGGSAPYQPPTLPMTSQSLTIESTGPQAAAELVAACQMGGVAVEIPDAAGHIGNLDLGNVQDCDILLGPMVVANFVYVGHLPGPMVAPAHRVRIRGGQIGSVMADPGSSDIVFDGVIINNAVLPPAQRSGTGIYLIDDGQGGIVERIAFVNSIIRLVGTLPSPEGDIDGCAYLAGNARDVLFANNNVVTDGNRNSWGFRISGGENYIFVDNSVRVSFHKLIRMNDGPVDYVYVKNGTWMREATLTAGGLEINDSFAQLGDLGTDEVYIHDPEIYLLSAEPVVFGASFGPGQIDKLWEARNIQWHARDAGVVDDTLLTGYQDGCTDGALCDYGIGTHSYDYDANLVFPTDPWRELPTIAEDDPDAQPIAP